MPVGEDFQPRGADEKAAQAFAVQESAVLAGHGEEPGLPCKGCRRGMTGDVVEGVIQHFKTEPALGAQHGIVQGGEVRTFAHKILCRWVDFKTALLLGKQLD